MKYLVATFILALAFTASAGASGRQFTYSIGTYERAVDATVSRAHWKNTGTDCVFRSGRTVVFCLTFTTKWGRLTTTMRRISATKIRFSMVFVDEGPSHTWTGPGQ